MEASRSVGRLCGKRRWSLGWDSGAWGGGGVKLRGFDEGGGLPGWGGVSEAGGGTGQEWSEDGGHLVCVIPCGEAGDLVLAVCPARALVPLFIAPSDCF